MPHYNNRQRLISLDQSDLEEFLDNRGLDSIIFRNNFVFNYTDTKSYAFIEHVWSHGDRLYKLSRKYYGGLNSYWLIGLFNKKPTDGHYKMGDVVYIPVNAALYLSEVIK